MAETRRLRLLINYSKIQVAGWAAAATVALAAACAGCQKDDSAVDARSGEARDEISEPAEQSGPSQLVESVRSGRSPVSPASFEDDRLENIQQWDPLHQNDGVPVGQPKMVGEAAATGSSEHDYPSTGIELWDPLQDTMSPTRQAALPIEVE